ncbi:hypothetical protein AB0J82_06200 [Asanoa sp. NPDC049518]|uniref:hypothetical protein n=1 Tax=unclassified Asanoa TaxID=2685164 RepID=UPI0034409F7A
MTIIAALLPRVPRLRISTGTVIAIRCTSCHEWRKPRQFTANSNTCRPCCKDPGRRLHRTRQNAGHR